MDGARYRPALGLMIGQWKRKAGPDRLNFFTPLYHHILDSSTPCTLIPVPGMDNPQPFRLE